MTAREGAIDWARVVVTIDLPGFAEVVKFAAAAEALLITDPQDTFLVDPDPYPTYCKICTARRGEKTVYDQHTFESHAESCRYLKARQAYDAMVAQLTKGESDAEVPTSGD